ncbi:immunoglobulin domain-containing protein, partial [Salmonella enterica subsp. enterica serovar Kentucky]|uniref:immunoglobulin domain-containing protein n=1 Tax=Salmonella enterica TaxID=28901 RepID=UPI003F4BBD04
QNIQKNDEGVYRCSINRLGIVDSRFINVNVLERSELAPRIVEPMSPIEVVYGGPLYLVCQLEVQRDNILYTWTVDTDFEDNHFKNTTPTFHRDAYQFLGGRYTCKAENEYGYDEQVSYVRILGKSY